MTSNSSSSSSPTSETGTGNGNTGNGNTGTGNGNTGTGNGNTGIDIDIGTCTGNNGLPVGCSFVSLRAGDLLSKYFGQTEELIRLVFAKARENAPCVLFLDDFEVSLKSECRRQKSEGRRQKAEG